MATCTVSRCSLNASEFSDLKDKLHIPINPGDVVVRQSLSDRFIAAFNQQIRENQRFTKPLDLVSERCCRWRYTLSVCSVFILTFAGVGVLHRLHAADCGLQAAEDVCGQQRGPRQPNAVPAVLLQTHVVHGLHGALVRQSPEAERARAVDGRQVAVSHLSKRLLRARRRYHRLSRFDRSISCRAVDLTERCSRIAAQP